VQLWAMAGTEIADIPPGGLQNTMSPPEPASVKSSAPRPALPRSVAVACDEHLQWRLFELLRECEDTRVVSCSSLRQLAALCSEEAIDVAVIDVDHFELDPTEVVGVGGLLGRCVRLVAVTSGPTPWTGSHARHDRLRWIRHPVSAEQIVMILRQGPPTAYVSGMPPRSHS